MCRKDKPGDIYFVFLTTEVLSISTLSARKRKRSKNGMKTNAMVTRVDTAMGGRAASGFCFKV